MTLCYLHDSAIKTIIVDRVYSRSAIALNNTSELLYKLL